MEEYLNELFDQHWKGLFPWEDLTKEDKSRFTMTYTAQEFYTALREAYNLGIEIAAANIDVPKDREFSDVIDKLYIFE